VWRVLGALYKSSPASLRSDGDSAFLLEP
jgi:hypothetical protein